LYGGIATQEFCYIKSDQAVQSWQLLSSFEESLTRWSAKTIIQWEKDSEKQNSFNEEL